MPDAHRVRIIAALLAGLLPAMAAAHNLQVFASADGPTISGRVYFAGGHPARSTPVRISNEEDELLAELRTDSEGRFSYRAAAAVDHRIIAGGADGHAAEWVIDGDELTVGVDGAAGQADLGGQGLDAVDKSSPSSNGVGASRQGSDSAPRIGGSAAAARASPALDAEIERAIARQLRPLREELAAARAQAGLRDVLGGLGWIMGLTGLLLWWRCRSDRRAPDRPK